MGFVQFPREAARKLWTTRNGRKALERARTKGWVRQRAEAGPVTRQTRGILGESRQREAAAVGFTVKVWQGIRVAEAWRIIMTSPGEGVAVNGTISSGRSDKQDK